MLANLKKEKFSPELLQRVRNIVARLQGRKVAPTVPETTEIEFISKEYGTVSIDKLGLDAAVAISSNKDLMRSEHV